MYEPINKTEYLYLVWRLFTNTGVIFEFMDFFMQLLGYRKSNPATLKTFFLLDSSLVQFSCAPLKSTLLSGRLFPGFWFQ